MPAKNKVQVYVNLSVHAPAVAGVVAERFMQMIAFYLAANCVGLAKEEVKIDLKTEAARSGEGAGDALLIYIEVNAEMMMSVVQALEDLDAQLKKLAVTGSISDVYASIVFEQIGGEKKRARCCIQAL